MDDSVLLGIDVRTSGTKSVVVDPSGRILGQGLKAYGCERPHPGWVEQDSNWWIDGIKISAAQALESSKHVWSQVSGLAITHQRLTVVPVDKQGNPVYPAILWNERAARRRTNGHLRLLGRKQSFIIPDLCQDSGVCTRSSV
jgi:sugar (pentulose or hexulose) kinase